MPDHSFSKEIFPKIQSKPPLMQLEAIASRPTASYLGEERCISAHLLFYLQGFSLSSLHVRVCPDF